MPSFLQEQVATPAGALGKDVALGVLICLLAGLLDLLPWLTTGGAAAGVGYVAGVGNVPVELTMWWRWFPTVTCGEWPRWANAPSRQLLVPPRAGRTKQAE